MLIVDGVEDRSCTPSSEAELEELVEAHSKRIFGEDSLYFPVKTRLRSLGGVGSIPDGYVLSLSKPYRWWIVEVELSSHRIFEHIVPQLSKFVQGIKDPDSRKRIVRALYDEITGDAMTEAYVRKAIGSGEIYRFVSDVVEVPPKLAVIIDEKTKELEEACGSVSIFDKRIVEFKVFERVDAGIKNAFLFEPIVEKKPSIEGVGAGEGVRIVNTPITIPGEPPRSRGRIWELVYEAAKELQQEVFTASQIIKKIHEKYPDVKSNSIRCHVIGMAPNHPSSIHYPSLRKNHPYFNYLGDGSYKLYASEMAQGS